MQKEVRKILARDENTPEGESETARALLCKYAQLKGINPVYRKVLKLSPPE